MIHADGRTEWMGDNAIFLDIEVHRKDRYQDNVHRGSTACQVTVDPPKLQSGNCISGSCGRP